VSDLFLILTPLLVLVVVLFLGFAGCSFEHGVAVPTLTLQAFVASNLTAVGGVTFLWQRPGQSMWEQATVTSFTPITGNNIFEHPVPLPEPGEWQIRCTMVAEGDGSLQVGDTSCPHNMEESGDWLFLFEASGTPLNNFRLLCIGGQRRN
jgi:hypothetical protein